MAIYDFFSTVRYYQTIQWNGVNQPQEEILNFIATYSITISDDPTNFRTNVTFAPNLEALAAFSALGIVVYTGSNTFAARTITGTTNRITVTNGNGVAGNPTIDIAATYPGQTSINTVGTITTGTWNGNVITGTYGGTGVNNGASTITVGGNFSTIGAFSLAFTLTGNTALTLPTSGTLVADPTTTKGDLIVRTASGLTRLPVGTDTYILQADSTQTTGVKWSPLGAIPAYTTVQDEGINLTQRAILNFVGSAVTAADDAANSRTNVTFATVLNNLASGIPLPLNLGGTNANLTASNGGIFYSTASAGAILGGTATANQVLLSGNSSAPSWSTATYPATTVANQILYSNATNTVTGLATANNGVLITSGVGVPSISSTLPSAVQTNITSVGTVTSGTWQATTIGVQYGGTGLNSINQGDLLYGSALNTVAALPKNTTATRYLANTGTSNNPNWDQINLTNGVTGALPIANGGTGQTTKTAAFDALAPTTTQGDIIYNNGTNNVRLGAGTAGYFLQTQGAGANPIWAQAGVNVQTFNASGTWTKPSSGTWAFIQAWGAGGSGGSGSTNAVRGGGGGGGSYTELWIPLSLLGATVTVTVGTGGTAVTGSSNGNPGGNSTFGTLLTAFGGGGGAGSSSANGGGGGGAGQGAAGVTATTGTGANGGRGVTTNSVCAGGVASGGVGSDGSIDSGGSGGLNGGNAYRGGAGGGTGSPTASNTAGNGGSSVFGGAGGGGATNTGTAGTGGTSSVGGNGGAGGSNSVAAGNGTQPGGGGGGSANNTSSGIGGDGRVLVIVF